MSRYLCEKTVKESPTGIITYTAGKVYPEDKFQIFPDGWVCLTNDHGEKNAFTGSFLKEHFRELEEIPDEMYENPMEAPFFLQDHKGCSKGVAICIVSALTLAAIVSWALIWRS